jgi:hypothetical protein
MKKFLKLRAAHVYLKSNIEEFEVNPFHKFPEEFSVHLTNIISCLGSRFFIQKYSLKLFSRYLDLIARNLFYITCPRQNLVGCGIVEFLNSAGYTCANKEIFEQELKKLSLDKQILSKQIWSSVQSQLHHEFAKELFEAFAEDLLIPAPNETDEEYKVTFFEVLNWASKHYDDSYALSRLFKNCFSYEHIPNYLYKILVYIDDHLPPKLKVNEMDQVIELVNKVNSTRSRFFYTYSENFLNRFEKIKALLNNDYEVVSENIIEISSSN